MTVVVTDACIQCKYTDCVSVCPVDAFHEGPNFLVINPDECICCSLCIPECPADALMHEEELHGEQSVFIELNSDLAKKWPVISRQKAALADAALWKGKANKLSLLQLD